MATRYLIKPGDSLSKIANRYGVKWENLYNDPLNAAFRKKRPNPGYIFPGDVLFIPDTFKNYYVVQNVPLIAQTKSMACWYASARMVVQWRRNTCQMTFLGEPDPSELPWAIQKQKANNGLSLKEILRYASLMGFKHVPPMTPTLDALTSWLKWYGPIWTAGLKVTKSASYGHVVVIVGIRNNGILIHDPEPVNKGTRVWKPISWLTTTLTLKTQTIPTNFLHYPEQRTSAWGC